MTTESAPKPQVEKTERDYQMVAVSVPNDLASAIEAKAKNEKVATTVLARRFIAQAMGYDITQFEKTRKRGRVPGLSDEERKAHAAAAQKERAEVVRVLMEKFKRGEIQVSDEERAELAKTVKPRKPRAAKAN